MLERFPDVGEGSESGKGFTTGGRVWEKGFGARKPAQKGFTGKKKLIAGDARLKWGICGCKGDALYRDFSLRGTDYRGAVTSIV